MALIDEVESRFSAELRKQMTRPDSTAQTPDTTLLQVLCDDAEAEFKTLVGIEFDITERQHIVAILDLVKLKAWEYGASADVSAEKLQARVEKKLEDLGKVTARDRVEPKSSSELTPSDEVEAGQTVKPAFDNDFFEDLIPDEPASGTPRDLD